MALIGSNGAGKSTCLKALAGNSAAGRGQHPAGRRGARRGARPPHRRARHGAGAGGPAAVRRPDRHGQPAARRLSPPDCGTASRACAPSAEEFLEQFPILRERQNLPAGGLSGGQQQMLAISRGLMASPRLHSARRAVARSGAAAGAADLRHHQATCAAPAGPSCSSSRWRTSRCAWRTAPTSWSRAGSC